MPATALAQKAFGFQATFYTVQAVMILATLSTTGGSRETRCRMIPPCPPVTR